MRLKPRSAPVGYAAEYLIPSPHVHFSAHVQVGYYTIFTLHKPTSNSSHPQPQSPVKWHPHENFTGAGRAGNVQPAKDSTPAAFNPSTNLPASTTVISRTPYSSISPVASCLVMKSNNGVIFGESQSQILESSNPFMIPPWSHTDGPSTAAS